MFDLLNSKEMQIADKETIDNGTPSILLMERAGKAIFNKIKKFYLIYDDIISTILALLRMLLISSFGITAIKTPSNIYLLPLST